MVRVIHSDLELFLTKFLRDELATRPEPFTDGVYVSNSEWVQPPSGGARPKRQIIVRDDSGPKLSVISKESQVGISVLAGTKETPKEAKDLALLLMAICEGAPSIEAGNPVAAVTEANGPYPVAEESSYARFYFTITFIVAGQRLV